MAIQNAWVRRKSQFGVSEKENATYYNAVALRDKIFVDVERGYFTITAYSMYKFILPKCLCTQDTQLPQN